MERGSGCRPGDGAFAQRGGASGAQELVQFARREHEQKPFAHRLRAAAFWAIEFAGRECSKLLLRHGLNLYQMAENIKQDFHRGLAGVNPVQQLFLFDRAKPDGSAA